MGRRLGANKPTHQQDSLSAQPGRVGSGLVELLGTQVGIGEGPGTAATSQVPQPVATTSLSLMGK